MPNEVEPNREGRPWVTVAGVVEVGGKYLVGLHHGEQWVFPGGRVDPFESMRTALTREFREEAGLDIVPVKQLQTFEVIHHGGDHHSIVVVYQAKLVGAGSKPKAGDDLPEVAFMHADAIGTDDRTAEITLRILNWLEP